MPIKEMELVNPALRKTIDLRDFQSDITNAVLSVRPNAKVTVYKEYYETVTAAQISNPEARMIGKFLARNSQLGQYVKKYQYGESKEKRSGQLFRKRK